MKALSLRLGQFAVCALLVTAMFRYALNLCIGKESMLAAVSCSVIYFCLMYYIGYYFGGKDAVENGYHDIGFRFHLATYVICIGVGIGAYCIGWYTEPLKAMAITAISWGFGLLIHFIFFLIAQKSTIKGYAREEIFQ